MELNLADLFELVVDEVPDATAMVAGGPREAEGHWGRRDSGRTGPARGA